jgi:hypothetical protein
MSGQSAYAITGRSDLFINQENSRADYWTGRREGRVGRKIPGEKWVDTWVFNDSVAGI